MGSRANKVCNIAGGQNDKNEVILLRVHHEKARFSGKDNNAVEHRMQQEMRKTKYETD